MKYRPFPEMRRGVDRGPPLPCLSGWGGTPSGSWQGGRGYPPLLCPEGWVPPLPGANLVFAFSDGAPREAQAGYVETGGGWVPLPGPEGGLPPPPLAYGWGGPRPTPLPAFPGRGYYPPVVLRGAGCSSFGGVAGTGRTCRDPGK